LELHYLIELVVCFQWTQEDSFFLNIENNA